jgi:hypothetical protein
VYPDVRAKEAVFSGNLAIASLGQPGRCGVSRTGVGNIPHYYDDAIITMTPVMDQKSCSL